MEIYEKTEEKSLKIKEKWISFMFSRLRQNREEIETFFGLNFDTETRLLDPFLGLFGPKRHPSICPKIIYEY